MEETGTTAGEEMIDKPAGEQLLDTTAGEQLAGTTAGEQLADTTAGEATVGTVASVATVGTVASAVMADDMRVLAVLLALVVSLDYNHSLHYRRHICSELSLLA